MNKLYTIRQTLLLGVLIVSGVVSAQVQLNQLADFGTAIYDINNQGSGVHGSGYYDFSTNSSSFPETGVAQTVANNDADQVVGLLDDGAGNFVPGYRNEGVWSTFPSTAFNPAVSYTIYDISENGIYVVGQTGWTPEDGAWGFIYNTQTETFRLLSSDLYEYGAAYGVNNDGIAVGWVDDLPGGTVRMPAYFFEDGTIMLIQETHGEAYGISENNVVTGTFGGSPFIYDIDADEFTTYTVPDGYISASFSDISENGVVVGYAEKFVDGEGFLRDPILYHADLGAEPQFLSDVLNGFEIDASTLDGQAYRISSDGNYVAGWGNGPAFMALGWAVYFDDLLVDGGSEYCQPVLDCTDGDLITNVTFSGIDNTTTCSPDGYGDYTDQIAEVEVGNTYPISVTVGDGWPFESVSVWIDYDNSGTFDENEFTYIGTGTAGPVTGEISIPEDVAAGLYRMRVRVAAVGEASATWDMACDEDQGFGETGDYTVNVGELGISSINNASFTYYPNPVNEVLNFNTKKSIETISVFNMAGQQIMDGSKVSNGQVNVSSLTPGVYLFRVILEGGQVETFKIIKK